MTIKLSGAHVHIVGYGNGAYSDPLVIDTTNNHQQTVFSYYLSMEKIYRILTLTVGVPASGVARTEP